MKYSDTLTRQMDIIPFDKLAKSITIIGAGAVGSWTSLALAKMGFLNQTVWDMDTVDVENLNCQFFPAASVGSSKAMALEYMIERFTGQKIKTVEDKYTASPLRDSIVIAAVDNMQVRKDIFDNCHGMFIDPRMGAEQMHLYVMNKKIEKDNTDYMNSWYPDSGAEHEACTAKSTIYCANILAGLVAKAVKDIATDNKYMRVTRWDLNGLAPRTGGFESWVCE